MWPFNKKVKEEREAPQNTQTQDQECTCASDSLSFASLLTQNYSYRSISPVFACVELISTSIASIPLLVVDEDSCGNRTIVKHHPLQRIFKGKNVQTMSMYQIMKSVMQDVLLKGNGYILINRNETGIVTSLRYLPAGSVSPQYQEYNDTLYYIVSVKVGSDSKKSMKIQPKDIIHITRTTKDGVIGVATTTFASDTIELAKSSETAAKKFFDSNLNVSGLLSCKVALNEKQRQDIKNAWQSGRGENVLQVLPMGVDYVQLGVAAKDAQLLESRDHNAVEIARFFGVPIQLIQSAQNLTYKALEDLNNIFYQYTLLGYIRSIEEEFTRKLFIDDDFIVDMDENEFLMRVNKQTLSSYLTSLVGGGIMTINEARKELGLPEVDDADKLHIAYSDASKAQIGDENKNPDE